MTGATALNTLYYGDNLDVMRRYIADESIDLVYLDPPFNSARDYNVLFEAKDGHDSAAQIAAFEDTWRWDEAAAAQFDETVSQGGSVADALQAFRTLVGTNDMLAYLTMMAPRLVELRRVLKDTGSLYLHCDPTASHYLKLLLDAVFGPENYMNEIIWKRTSSKGLMTKRLATNHDTILVYQRSSEAHINTSAMFVAYDESNLDPKTAGKYSHRDEHDRLYQLDNLINPNPDRPNLTYEFLGVTRVWRWTKARMEKAYADGIVVQPRPGAVPRMKRYLDEQRGQPIGDVWQDIAPLNSQAQERLGYPTQKPEKLLDRIIQLFSNEGDLVLDPFCGCGTTVASAQRLGRRWIGIDITHLAIGLIRQRLKDSYGANAKFAVVGEPTTVEGAEELRDEDKFQFQAWALGLVGARVSNSAKKGADKGIDGRIYFQSGETSGKTDQVIISVKGGGLKADDLRALGGVIDREKAKIGVLIAFDEPSKKMRTDAAAFGLVDTAWGKFPKMQILTITELLAGAEIKYPHRVTGIDQTFKRAPKAKAVSPGKLSLFDG